MPNLKWKMENAFCSRFRNLLTVATCVARLKPRSGDHKSMKRLAIKLSSLSFVCLLSLLAAQTSSSDAANSSNWPQWRGPDAQGVSNDKNLPTEWGETKNVLWKAAIPGKGFSQPIIWDKKVFLTTDIEGGPAPDTHKAPTHFYAGKEFRHPDWDGVDKLHTFKTLCLDRDTGKILWEKTS